MLDTALVREPTQANNAQKNTANQGRAQQASALPVSGMQVVAIHLMFFCSGLASLICEVVWFKQLQFILGSSTYAVSVVVACFFGGLALGSWLVGRLADRWVHLLRAYARLELSLALASAVVTLVLANWTVWVEWLAPWLGPQAPTARPMVILVSFLLLIVPTSLMGATLPVLAKYLVREQNQLARRIGALYGINTLGGALGCFLVGFVLIGWLGVAVSALIGSCLYAAIAVAATLFSLRASTGAATLVADPEVEARSLEAPGAEAVSTRSLLLLFALMGFTSIAYEVLWFRLLTYFGVHTVYAFAGMLGVYLLGLVAGSFLCARYLAPRTSMHLVDLARAQLLLSAAALCSLILLGRSRQILSVITDLEQRLPGQEFWSSALSGMMPFLIFCFVVLLIPTTIIGVCLPLVTALTTQRLSGLGARLGALYSLNTVGGILGSVVTGFLLIPFLGSQWSFLTVVALNLLVFALLTATQPGLAGNRVLRREGLVTLAAIAAVCVWLGPVYLQKELTDFADATVLAFKENADASFAVLQYDIPEVGRAQQLVVNGTSYANNGPFGRRYMATLGHLPALLHPDPKSSLVICIGTGTTVGSLTLHPGMEKVHAVDIASAVFEVAPNFVPLNSRFYESPKVRKVVADGRHFLLCTDERFDVLTFEPPPPQEAGVVNLYCREFYQLAKRRMKPGAILCQWMPLELDREVLPRMMLQTLMAEFPHVSLWIPNRKEGVAIASTEPLKIDLERLRERMADPKLHADLTAYGLGEPEQLAATFVAADEALARFVGAVPMVTDNQPRIEYYQRYPVKASRLADILPHRERVATYLAHPPANPARLRACEEVITHIWYNHEKKVDKQFAEATALVEKALQLDPNNRYLHYLRVRPEE